MKLLIHVHRMEKHKLVHYDHQVEANPSDSINLLKCKIFEADGVLQPERCYYIVDGQFLEDDRMVKHYNMSNCTEVHVVKRMTAGKLFVDEAAIRREEAKKLARETRERKRQAKLEQRRKRRQMKKKMADDPGMQRRRIYYGQPGFGNPRHGGYGYNYGHGW